MLPSQLNVFRELVGALARLAAAAPSRLVAGSGAPSYYRPLAAWDHGPNARKSPFSLHLADSMTPVNEGSE